MILRTGIDLAEIDRLAEISPAIRARFLKRVYTMLELEQAGDNYESLTGLFAAKEAVSKALGTGIGFVRWQDIEIVHLNSGAPTVRLHGNARLVADYLGLTIWSVSITHSRRYAAATATAVGPDAEDKPLPPRPQRNLEDNADPGRQ